MIDWYQAVVLAVVQGLTEFLPISSSAHLVIPSLLLDWPDQGLAFDVAVHVGTLSAVMFYYRNDLLTMAGAWLRSLAGGEASDDSRMVWYLAAATIPVGILGFLGGQFIEGHMRTLPVIASTTLVFGVVLGLADRYAQGTPGDRKLTLPLALLIGCAQALAPVPGVSRSGITITAALMLNMSRQNAARFSFLLSIPVIVSAGALKTWELTNSGNDMHWQLMAIGACVSGLVAYFCIALFLRLLDRLGMMPFVYYRVVLAALLYTIWLA